MVSSYLRMMEGLATDAFKEVAQDLAEDVGLESEAGTSEEPVVGTTLA